MLNWLTLMKELECGHILRFSNKEHSHPCINSIQLRRRIVIPLIFGCCSLWIKSFFWFISNSRYQLIDIQIECYSDSNQIFFYSSKSVILFFKSVIFVFVYSTKFIFVYSRIWLKTTMHKKWQKFRINQEKIQ